MAVCSLALLPRREMKVLITLQHRFELWNAPAWLQERLRSDFPNINIVHKPYKDLAEQIADVDVFIGWSLRPEQLKAAKQLRWIHSPAAGVHQLMFPQLIASDIVVTNAREVHGPVVAEHALAAMLALAKRLPSALRYQQNHVWGQESMWNERPRPRELAGSTLCLVGFGSIGRHLAQRALALGMHVLVIREHPEKEDPLVGRSPEGGRGGGSLAVRGPADLDPALSSADFVVLAVPLTPKTRNLINAQTLSRMQAASYLINVSRGPVIDESALVAVLRHHKIAGAALDVFSSEPLPADSPLWDLDNLLMTPHTAAVTEKLWERHYALIAENLRRFVSGEPLLGMVDKNTGY